MIGFIIAGLIIGALARLFMPGRQRLLAARTLLLGLAGAVIGGSIANLIGTGDIMELNVIGFVIAVLCSIGLLAVAERAGLANSPTANDSAAPSRHRPWSPTRPPWAFRSHTHRTRRRGFRVARDKGEAKVR